MVSLFLGFGLSISVCIFLDFAEARCDGIFENRLVSVYSCYKGGLDFENLRSPWSWKVFGEWAGPKVCILWWPRERLPAEVQ